MKKGWQMRRIGEVCDVATGGTPSRSQPDYFGGDIKWLVSGDIHQGEIFDCQGRITAAGMRHSNAKWLPPHSVMMALNGQGRTRATVALLRTYATCNQSMVCMTPKADSGLLPEFLYGNLQGRYEEIRRLTSDDDKDRRGLNMGIVRSIEIPIAPLAEQQRIVGVLAEAFAGLATAEANSAKNVKNARALFESHLNSLFAQRGKGWVEKRLDELGRTQTGSTPKTSDHTNYGTAIPFVKPADFNPDGSLDYGNDGLSTTGRANARVVPGGSVLMVCIGATIGKCGYSDRDVTTNQQINALTPVDGSSHRFLYYQMLTESFQRSVIHRSGQATLPIINKSKWSALSVWLPPTLAEQKGLATQLDALAAETRRLTRLYEQKKAALAELKKSLLHQAFSGNL